MKEPPVRLRLFRISRVIIARWSVRVTPVASVSLAILLFPFSHTTAAVGPLDVWTERPAGTTNYLSGIAYGNGQWVAVGELGTIMRSDDAVHWVRSPFERQDSLTAIAYGDGQFVAVGSLSTNNTIV